MSYARICESCYKELVEVDNPIRREIRHRRGEEVSCPAWRESAGLPALTQGAPSGLNPDPEQRDIGPVAIANDEASAHAGEAPAREPGGR